MFTVLSLHAKFHKKSLKTIKVYLKEKLKIVTLVFQHSQGSSENCQQKNAGETCSLD